MLVRIEFMPVSFFYWRQGHCDVVCTYVLSGFPMFLQCASNLTSVHWIYYKGFNEYSTYSGLCVDFGSIYRFHCRFSGHFLHPDCVHHFCPSVFSSFVHVESKFHWIYRQAAILCVHAVKTSGLV